MAMRAFRASVLFAVFLTIAGAAVAASKQDWSECKQFRDVDSRIAGCTRVLQDSSEGKENRALAYLNRGLAHALNRNYDGAIRDYNETLRLDPGAFLAYLSRGRVFNTRRYHDLAIADFTKAISLKPDHPSGYGHRGFAYRDMGEKDLAIADFRKMLQLDPKSETALKHLRELGATP